MRISPPLLPSSMRRRDIVLGVYLVLTVAVLGVVAVAALIPVGELDPDAWKTPPTTSTPSTTSTTVVLPVDMLLRVEHERVVPDPDYISATYPQGVCGWSGPEMRFVDGGLVADDDVLLRQRRILDYATATSGDLFGDSGSETVLHIGCARSGTYVESELLVLDDEHRVTYVLHPQHAAAPSQRTMFGEVEIQDRQLVVTELIVLDGDVNCCPSGRRTDVYEFGDLEVVDP